MILQPSMCICNISYERGKVTFMVRSESKRSFCTTGKMKKMATAARLPKYC